MSGRYPVVQDGDALPFDLDDGEIFKLACCDCGLVHDMCVRIVDGRVGLAMRRNARATAAKRRKTKRQAAGL